MAPIDLFGCCGLRKSSEKKVPKLIDGVPCDVCGSAALIVASGRGLCHSCALNMMDSDAFDSDSDEG